LNDITQLAVVTPHLDDTIRRLRKSFNLGAFKVWVFHPPALFDTTYLGKPEAWRMKLAVGWVGDMQLELIQPEGGQNLYQSYLDWKGRAGLQHFLINRGDQSYGGMKDQLAEIGFPIVQEGRTNVPLRFAGITFPPLPTFLAKKWATTFGYTDTFETLKISLETSRFPPGISPRLGLRLGVPDYWIGEDRGSFEQLPEGSLLTGISKLYVLVEEIDGVVAAYQKLRAETLESFETTVTDLESGLSYQIKLAFINLRSTQIVLLQPMDEGSFFASLLAERGEGGQILGATSRDNDLEVVLRRFQEKGYQMALSIRIGEQRLTYFYDPGAPFAVEIALPEGL
jgi:hypothetical protein